MTAKDKKLLVIAGGLILTLAIIMFGIKPGITGWTEAKAKKEELAAKKASMETEINSLSTYNAELDQAVADYQKTADRVYGDLTNDKIQDAVVNELITPCGLSVTNFSISSIDKMAISQFVARSTEATATEDGTAAPQGTTSTEGTIRVATISVSVYGSTDQIVNFLDTLNNDEGILAQQTSFGNSAEANTAVSVSFLMVLSETF